MSADLATIYGMSDGYRHRLLDLCDQLDVRVYNGIGRRCTGKLHDRRHRCSHNYDERNWWHIDHDVWLRDDAGRFVVLAQPYPGSCRIEIQQTRATFGLTVIGCGPAPYGHGTDGYLIVGDDRPRCSR